MPVTIRIITLFVGDPYRIDKPSFEIITGWGGRSKVPIPSMYGIFTYIYHKNQPNVGKYTIHGWYGV